MAKDVRKEKKKRSDPPEVTDPLAERNSEEIAPETGKSEREREQMHARWEV